MSFKLFTFLVLAVTCASSKTQSTFEFSLDTYDDVKGGWKLNRNHSSTQYTKWFAYFDSLGEIDSDQAKRFQKLDLDLDSYELNSAVGVWAAFHVEQSPFAKLPYPEIIFLHTNQILSQVEVTYYVHGNGAIAAVSSSNVTEAKVLTGSDPYGEWRTDRFELQGHEQLKFILQAKDVGDCVLLDKIVVKS